MSLTTVTQSRALLYLEEGGFQGGLCLLLLLQEMPSLTSTAHWGTCALDDDRAGLMEGVCLAAGKEDVNVVGASPGKVWGNILYTDEVGSTSFS